MNAVHQTGLPRNLNLRRYGLEDAFGIDIDFILNIASTGDVEFELEPHMRRNVLGGFTERYPLTFAYCYYQYAKRIMQELYTKGYVELQTKRDYLAWWHLLFMRGLAVVYQPSERRDEKNTDRIRQHLKIPAFLYLLKEMLQNKTKISGEMRSLIFTAYLPKRFLLFKWIKLGLVYRAGSFICRIIKSFVAQPIRFIFKIRGKFTNIFNALILNLHYKLGMNSVNSKPKIILLFYSIYYDLYLNFAFKFSWLSSFKKLSSSDKTDYLVNISVWGDYSNTFINFLAPCLLSENNIKAANTKKIKILFSCSKDFRKQFRSNATCIELSRYYRIEFNVLGDFFLYTCLPNFKHDLIYNILGSMQNKAALIAIKEQAVLIPLFPDFIIEEAFFSKIMDLHKKYDALLTTIFRSDIREINQHLKHTKQGTPNSNNKCVIPLSLSAQEIVNMQCAALHEETLNRIISPSKSEFSITPQLIFKNKNQIIIKAYHWTPLFISHVILKSMALLKLEPIDAYFVSTYANIKSKKVYFLEDASQVGVCEISYPDKVGPIQEKPASLSLDKMLIEYFGKIILNENVLYTLSKKIVFAPNFKLKLQYKDLDPQWLHSKVLSHFIIKK